MSIQTAWVAPPRQTTGLDHLAVRAVSEAFYAELVPCVTNVTDRVRSYAYYAWATWSFNQRYPDAPYDQFVEYFRRAECLMTLAGARHEQATKGPAEQHGGGLPGRAALLPALDRLNRGDGELRLSSHSVREEKNPLRYFKAELGGFQQYFLGTLQELDIVGRPEKGAPGKWLVVSPGRGVVVAKEYAQSVPGDSFWQAVEGDSVSLDTLDGLAPFCPCHLKGLPSEIEKLLEIILNRDGHANAPNMRDATRLLLESLEHGSADARTRDDAVEAFRWGTYAGALVSGVTWSGDAVTSWRAYQQHELLGLSVQALFWLVYDSFEKTRPSLYSGSEMADWILNTRESEFSPGFLHDSFESFCNRVGAAAPDRSEIDAEGHEKSLCHKIGNREDFSFAEGLETVAQLMATLLQRLPEGTLYPGFARDDSYFEAYPINLRRMRALARDDWSAMTVREWLRWLIVHWAVGQQQRVALRKLRYGQDTFRLRPTDKGFVPISNVEVTFSNPRLNEALRALQDMGFVDPDVQLTGSGRALRESLNG